MTMAITYTSRTAPDLPTVEVQNIWITSLDYNERHEITGALYFGGDFFMHTMEGEEEDVEPLFGKVSKDPRHRNIKVLAINDLAAPMFREIPMKLIDGSQSSFLQERFVYEDLIALKPADVAKSVFRLLKL